MAASGGPALNPQDHYNTVNNSLTNHGDDFLEYYGDEVNAKVSENDNVSSGRWNHRLLRFLLRATPFTQGIKLMLISVVLFLAGFLTFTLAPSATIFNANNHLFSLFNVAALVLFGYAFTMISVHALVLFLNRRDSLYDNEFVHFVTEFEEYFAALLTVGSYLILFAILKNHDWTNLPGSYSTAPIDFLLQVYLLGSQPPTAISKILIIALIIVVLTAYKHHAMRSLAMQFNYTNYRDRVADCLFMDRILQSLMKARLAYKFRKKWKNFMFGGTGRGSPAITETSNVHRRRNSIDVVVPGSAAAVTSTSGTATHTASPVTNTATAEFVDVSFDRDGIMKMKDQSEKNAARSLDDTSVPVQAVSPTSPALQNINAMTTQVQPPMNEMKPENTTTTTTTSPQPAKQLTDADKKRQFDEFFRLANRATIQFESGGDVRLEIHRESRRIARDLFKWLKPNERDYLVPSDLQPYIENSDDLKKVLGMMKRKVNNNSNNGTNNGYNNQQANETPNVITEGDLRRTIDVSLQDRYGLAKSMQSIEMALGKIDGILNFMLYALTGILLALALTDAIQILLAISTMLSGAAFVFGTSAKNTFESIIFLLVIHPFDVGDRVYIQLNTMTPTAGGDPADNLVVTEMHLMSTIFERWDGVKIYVPNHILAYKPVYNIRRSGPTIDIQRLQISHSTPVELINEFRRKLESFVRREKTDFTDLVRVNFELLENCNRIGLQIMVQHVTNWQDLEVQMSRRTKLLTWIKGTLEELGIGYLPPVQRIALVDGRNGGKLLTSSEAAQFTF